MNDVSRRSRWLGALAFSLLLVAGIWAVQPRPGAPEAAPWRLAGPVDPSDTEVSLLVHERACANGRPADGRIEAPTVTYSSTQIAVLVTIRPLGGDVDCQGVPETPYLLQLEEPVGDRRLVDASGLSPVLR